MDRRRRLVPGRTLGVVQVHDRPLFPSLYQEFFFNEKANTFVADVSRIAYPNTTVASLASSGVVNPIYDFYQFDEQVGLSAGEKCASVLRKTTTAFELQLHSGNGTAVNMCVDTHIRMIKVPVLNRFFPFCSPIADQGTDGGTGPL